MTYILTCDQERRGAFRFLDQSCSWMFSESQDGLHHQCGYSEQKEENDPNCDNAHPLMGKHTNWGLHLELMDQSSYYN